MAFRNASIAMEIFTQLFHTDKGKERIQRLLIIWQQMVVNQMYGKSSCIKIITLMEFANATTPMECCWQNMNIKMDCRGLVYSSIRDRERQSSSPN